MLSTEELEHLQILLSKEPIIATWTAQDLLERPETVRESYLKHVRSFVMIGRGARATDSDQPTISEYEKRLIKLVKENGAAKGYITAEYGYGKTSTSAFIWNRCEQSEIVAVPPFQIQKLEHLLSATYGWVRFKLANSAPQLLKQAEQLYQDSVKRGIEAETQDEAQQVLLRRLHQEDARGRGRNPSLLLHRLGTAARHWYAEHFVPNADTLCRRVLGMAVCAGRCAGP